MFFKYSHKLEYVMANDATSISISPVQDQNFLINQVHILPC